MAEISNNIEWNFRLESYFSGTGEKAHGLSWLHKKAQERYSALKNYTDLPVIILGVLNGSVSIGSASLFGDSPYASVGVGIIALITAILSTVSSYFKWAARAEAHRIAALQYSKLYRFLSVQCSLPRHERMTPAELLKYTKDAYDRMAEVAPLIPPEVVAEFKRRFDKPEFKDLSKPEETNGLEHIEVYGTTIPMSPTRTSADLLSYANKLSQVSKDADASSRSAKGVGITIDDIAIGGGVGAPHRPSSRSPSRSVQSRRGSVEVKSGERAAEEGLH